VFSIFAAFFALFTLMPRFGQKGQENNAGENSHLLVFSQASKLGRDEYLRQMDVLLQHDKNIYSAIVGDIHSQGRVLERKYRFLRLSYFTLSGGIVAALGLSIAQSVGLF
jgi:hypothetical protein